MKEKKNALLVYALNTTGSDFHNWPRFSVDIVYFLFTCFTAWKCSRTDKFKEPKANNGGVGGRNKEKKIREEKLETEKILSPLISSENCNSASEWVGL